MDVSVAFLTAGYTTDQGDSLTLYRPFVTAEFPSLAGHRIPRRCLIDTGAPLSVVPYSVWHVRKLQWSRVSQGLRGSGGAAALTWQGVPCELGHMTIDLAGPRKLVAKFASKPTSPLDIILGMNFLVDNGLEWILTAAAGPLTGNVVVP